MSERADDGMILWLDNDAFWAQFERRSGPLFVNGCGWVQERPAHVPALSGVVIGGLRPGGAVVPFPGQFPGQGRP